MAVDAFSSPTTNYPSWWFWSRTLLHRPLSHANELSRVNRYSPYELMQKDSMSKSESRDNIHSFQGLGTPTSVRFRRLIKTSGLLLLLLLLVVLPAAAIAQQPLGVIEEDLDETLEEPTPVVEEIHLDNEAVKQLFSDAEATLLAQDPAAFSLFGRLVDLFENHLSRSQEAADTVETLVSVDPAELVDAELVDDELVDPATSEDAAVELPADEATLAEDATPPPPPAESRFLDAEMRDLFVRSLLYRAQLAYDFGEDASVDSGLARALRVDPDLANPQLQSETGSSLTESLPQNLKDKLKRLRGKTIGLVEVTVDPPDAEVLLGGRSVDATRSNSVQAGALWVQVQRPGYASFEEEVDIRAGRTWSQEIVLERRSPALRFYTRPNGAEVYLDGQLIGSTSGQASDDLLNVGRYRREEFSEEMVVTDFEPGVRRLEIRKVGFRSYQAELEVYDLLDYPIPPIVLEGESGLLVFRDFPANGKLMVNGAAHALDNPGSSRPQTSLPPGEYRLTIESGSSSMFATRLRLADRQTVEVQVKLRPGLAFLGVIADDPGRRRDLDQALRQALGRSDKWALLDRSAGGAPLLQGLGVDKEALRKEAQAPVLGEHVDWSQVQWSADQRTPGLIYVLAVTSDSLLDRQSTLFIWPAAPGPALPDRVSLPSGAAEPLRRLEATFNRDLSLRRPWLGAVLADSPLTPHPLVYSVTPGGPAEAAGLLAGDQLIAVSQVPVFSEKDVLERLRAAEIGEVLDFGVQRRNGPHALRFSLRASPQVIDVEGEGLLPAVTFTDLRLAEEGAGPEDAWLLRLGQGRLLLEARQWEEAARTLRDVSAPQTSHGFGQAAVDYWLGLALEKLGSDYRDAARQAFERAVRLPDARLDHHDGPFVAPRAEARLLALGSF